MSECTLPAGWRVARRPDGTLPTEDALPVIDPLKARLLAEANGEVYVFPGKCEGCGDA
jgi:hypothetical protein